MNGKELQIKRKSLGLTCDDITKYIYVTRQTISNMELGRTNNKKLISRYENVLQRIERERA